MAMFTTYFDASGHPDQGKALSVAGFVATGEQWVQFERNWKDALTAYGLEELHMKEWAGKTWIGDNHKRRVFIERMINIIKTRCRHSFVCSVMLDDFRKVDARYCLSESNKPYALLGVNCIMHVKDWAKRYNIREEEIAYFFEDGDKHRGDLLRCADRDHGVAVKFMKKKESVAFQAADLLAYEHRRANQEMFAIGPGMLEMADLRHSLQALSDVTLGSENWGLYPEEALEAFCIGNKLPLRSTFPVPDPSGCTHPGC